MSPGTYAGAVTDDPEGAERIRMAKERKEGNARAAAELAAANQAQDDRIDDIKNAGVETTSTDARSLW